MEQISQSDQQVAARPGVRGWLASRAAPAVMLVAVSAGQAFAQTEQLLPPENKAGINGKVWTSGLITVLLLALVCVGAFLKTKRGHQD
jgi:hypothetical protein